ncbi:MAG: DUF4349 domain-containing protein [Bacteroidetes bacterium]|nr:DUF4349 domain-containing protein [Bacteroidota bacterium]
MKPALIFLTLGIALTILSCGPARNEKAAKSELADSTSNGFVSSSAAMEDTKDSVHKFIRTADLKFKVKNVIRSTYDIEDITKRQGGFVTYTNLESTIANVTTTNISADSTLETTYYSVTNTLTLRVPNTRLDTTLKEISRNIDFLDYRVIKADDVALSILSNNLTQKRMSGNEQRLTNAIDKRGKKLTETTDAEETLLDKQEQSDDAYIRNLSLKDRIQFSTINILIYQRQTLNRELIANEKSIKEYEPGLGRKILDALVSGWSMLESVLVFLVDLWGLFLFAIVAYFLYRRYYGAKNISSKRKE